MSLLEKKASGAARSGPETRRGNAFDRILERESIPLSRTAPEVLQLNLGRLCNQVCRHCHVNAGPTRTEMMSDATAREAIALMDRISSLSTLDLTGGAPEMIPCFRYLVEEGSRRGVKIIDRCNLTILNEPGYEYLAEFLASHRVEVVASLPCYSRENVDKQRGEGMFARSIKGLQQLNAFGYGVAEGKDAAEALRLHLVYNPGGPGLPPPQEKLEEAYRERLAEDFGILFDKVITIANMPIGRFRSDLLRSGQLDAYQTKLEEAFNPATVPHLMCRTHLSVDHEGYLYDCDFNQMLDLGMGGKRLHMGDVTAETLRRLPIATGDHCFGCTAGSGSSCGGALA